MDEQTLGSKDSIVEIDTHDIACGESITSSKFSEEKWIREMKSILNKEFGHEHKNVIPVRIFRVPKSVKAHKPEAYIPQRIALGPYHQFDPKFSELQKNKLHQAQILHQQPNFPEFQVLFDGIVREVRRVRRSYHGRLNIHDNTLSWIMVIDGLLLLQLIYKEAEESIQNSVQFADSFGRKFPIEEIFRDVVLIENQIPFFVIVKLDSLATASQEMIGSSLNLLPDFLYMSFKFCLRICPIALQDTSGPLLGVKPFHLLDLLYELVSLGEGILEPMSGAAIMHGIGSDIWGKLWDMIKTLNIQILTIPVKIIDLVLKIFQVFGISLSLQTEEEKAWIPTALQLSSVKIQLTRTDLGINDISFNKQNLILKLPVFKLNVNSDTIVRNLVTYESIAKPETPNFARYIELMAALIRTVKDVEMLKNKEMLLHDGDNDQVVKLFSGLKLPFHQMVNLDLINPSKTSTSITTITGR